MTPNRVNGHSVHSAYGIVERSTAVSPTFRDKVSALREHYYPIEIVRASFI